MRPSRPQIHPQSTADPPPQSSQSNHPMQFNSTQFAAGFNPRFPSPQNPNFDNGGPGGPPPPQFGKHQLHPNLNQVAAATDSNNCGPGGPLLPQFGMQQPHPQPNLNQLASAADFNNCGPGGPSLPQFGMQQPNLNQVVAAAALQLLQQQSNPQLPVNQAQNNNLAAALVQMASMLGGGQTMPMPGPQMGQFPPLNVNAAPSFQMPQQQQSAVPQQMGGMFGEGQTMPGPQMGQFPPVNGNPVPSSQIPQQQQQSAGFQCPPTPHQQQPAGFQMPQQQQSAGFQCPPTPHQQQQSAGFQMPQQQQSAGFQCPPTPHQQQPAGFQRPPTPQHQQSVRPMNGNLVRPFQPPRPMQQQQQHATHAMNQQFYPQTNGDQVLHHQPLPSQQQQRHLTSSMHTFNVPPSSLGSSQNSGNPTVLNGASQSNNQGPGQFAAPSSNAPGALQENTIIPQKLQPLTFPMGQWNNQGLGPFAAPSSNCPGALQENTIVPQNSQPLAFPMGDQPPWMNSSGLWRPQVNHASDLCQLAPNVMKKDFAGKVPGYEKGVQSNMRFQNHTPYAKNAKGNMGPSTKNGGQGRQQRKQKEQLNFSCEEPKRKFPSITYSEREVREWREARKKNYPTTDPIIKKLRRGGKVARIRLKRKWESDEDAKLHRQQLKEVLAKQKELEVNICDIPYEYLREPKKRNDKGRASTTEVGGASEPEKNNKGRASTSKVVGASEPEKKNDKGHPSTSKVVSAKRPPTLLQKLLGPEKLRDKSYLLQVFRFMALNNFFDQSPDKPFKFPVVKREGADKDDTDDEDDNDDSDVEGEEEKKEEDDGEAVVEHLGGKGSEKVDSDKTEEGEITD